MPTGTLIKDARTISVQYQSLNIGLVGFIPFISKQVLKKYFETSLIYVYVAMQPIKKVLCGTIEKCTLLS